MTTLSPEVRRDLALLRQQTEEVRRAVVTANHLALLRQQTVIRLRDAGVTYRTIAAAMGSSVAAVQSILTRAPQTTAPAQTLGAGATLTQKAGI
ncbi:RNA polymerase sigma factor [Mycobacteroides abscessus]|uniref:sigma-70 family RNA polymerase sigma factor n=1 Tax=Mycobacteroides abscessus TaxID=36809 RepID=UPI000C25C277|nr:sigma-70 family RNA polymerase sigma factor [Mycobacteroides abscessus]